MQPSIFQRLAAAIEREYERRVRRASQVHEYGVHDDHGHAAQPDHLPVTPEPPEDPASDDAVEIQNIPPGTRRHNNLAD